MRRFQRSAVFAIAAATFLSLLEIFRTTMMLSLGGGPVPWSEVGARLLPVWATLIAVSPWCALMAARFPFRHGRLLRASLAHVAGAAVFVFLHMLAIGLWSHFSAIPGAITRAARSRASTSCTRRSR